MCGRYTLVAPAPVFEDHFEARFREPLAPAYNAAPSQRLPVIRNNQPGQIELLSWGLVPAWAKDVKAGPRPINARSETLTEKPTFRQLVGGRRCLVLADSFYEWQTTPQGKVPHRILRQDEQPFAFAGLWDEWADRATGEVLPTFTIITTTANALMAPLHERMPVILPDRAAELRWLADEAGSAAHLAQLQPLPDGLLKAYAISTLVNSPTNNSAAVLQPVATSAS